ncbi:MAG: hypothetical protein P4L20_16160 [Acidimicrobiales bacterium]|nr:hypothetical protein [Acidimicrobiales bacterium]
MARRGKDLIEFRIEDSSPVVRAMDRLAVAHDGWVNLEPQVRPEDEPPPRAGLTTLLAGPVHDVPVCTWVAGKLTRHGVQPDSIGVQHAGGSRVLGRLASAGLALPEGWRLVQDHPRRGLVVTPAPDAPRQAVLTWILEAGAVLSAVRLTGEWLAQVHLPLEEGGGPKPGEL